MTAEILWYIWLAILLLLVISYLLRIRHAYLKRKYRQEFLDIFGMPPEMFDQAYIRKTMEKYYRIKKWTPEQIADYESRWQNYVALLVEDSEQMLKGSP